MKFRLIRAQVLRNLALSKGYQRIAFHHNEALLLGVPCVLQARRHELVVFVVAKPRSLAPWCLVSMAGYVQLLGDQESVR
jgi:hypothetical protein